MANYTAFVEAGESLSELLRSRLTPEPIESRELISVCSPHTPDNNQLTVSLFHIEEDAANLQSGYFQQSENVQRVRPTGYQLNFIITAHSKAPVKMRESDECRIIGAVCAVIKDNPVLPREFLRGSLSESGADIHISLERLNFEQMIKIWNDTASAYKLSVICRVSGVSIDSGRERRITRVSEVTIGVDINQ